jgi:hypothetical protein
MFIITPTPELSQRSFQKYSKRFREKHLNDLKLFSSFLSRAGQEN